MPLIDEFIGRLDTLLIRELGEERGLQTSERIVRLVKATHRPKRFSDKELEELIIVIIELMEFRPRLIMHKGNTQVVNSVRRFCEMMGLRNEQVEEAIRRTQRPSQNTR